jgi:hypothetical protein
MDAVILTEAQVACLKAAVTIGSEDRAVALPFEPSGEP